MALLYSNLINHKTSFFKTILSVKMPYSSVVNMDLKEVSSLYLNDLRGVLYLKPYNGFSSLARIW